MFHVHVPGLGVDALESAQLLQFDAAPPLHVAHVGSHG